MSTPATSHPKPDRETLTSTVSTAPTTLTTNPDPNPSQLLDLPTLTDTLPQLAHKLSALAAVISRGESIALATGRSSTVTVAEHHSIPGASTLSLAEVAELQTCRKAIDTSAEVQARVRSEVRRLTKEIHECSEVIRSRLVSLQAKNPKSKHYGKEFKGPERAGGGRSESNIPARAGAPVSIGSQLSSSGTELIPKVHGRSRGDLLRGTHLEGVRNSVSTLEGNAANGEDVRLSPSPPQGHRSSATSGQPSPRHYLGDVEQSENRGVLGEKGEQLEGSESPPEPPKRQRVR